AGEDEEIDDIIQSLEKPKPPGIFDKLRHPIQASKDACKAVKTWVSTMMDGWTRESVVEVSSRVMMVVSVLRTVWGVYSFLKDLGTNKEE
nr:non-structural protein 3A [limnipivirus B1]